ncbi:MAG: carboxypeptidase-like regulatory domain-containing protein, partial [Bacteroidales bacterium]|nr:carboxypeptidase-like regulatory domain-containing protein [Bacteroidales bacterium]
MRNFTKYLLTMMVIVLSSTVMLAQLRVSSSGGKTPVLPESRAVLYQQTNSAGSGRASQDFEPAYNAYDCQGADDFYVPAGLLWIIQTVTVTGTGSLTATVANVLIYADAGGIPAATATNSLMGLTCTNASGVLTIPIPGGLPLAPGHYWISVQDAAPYVTYGQWFWTMTSSIYNSQSCWRNPGGGFGGPVNWTTMAALGYPNADFMFRLEGTSGPVPTCDYQINLLDWFGDGWNGGSLDVLVNGTVVLDNITNNLPYPSYGPVTYYFNVPTGGMITTVYTAGSWPEENYYYIYNSEGSQVWYSTGSYPNGPPNIMPGQLYGSCPMTGAVDGYVFNYDGLAVSGATIIVENGPTTTSGPNGYYLLEDVNGGSTTIACTKTGYNTAIDVVAVLAGDTVPHNFTLTQPNMIINPLLIEETLNPGEYFTTSLNVLNNGNGPLGWEAVINYPETDNSGGNYIINPPGYQTEQVEPNGAASTGYGTVIENGSRDLMICPEGSLFSIPPVSSTNAYTSTLGAGYKCYQSYSGVEGAISAVTFWGVFAGYTLPTTPGNFLIELCQPGSMPGAVVTTVTIPLVGVNTGQLLLGSYQIGIFTAEIPPTDLPAGWLAVQFQASPTFYWNNTQAGAGFPAYQNSNPLPERLAMCLGGGGGAGSWLTMDYYEGNVPAFGGVDNIPTHLDAAGTAPGEVYTADVVFTSTPFVGEITVPVTMIIMGAELVAPENLEVTLINDITGEVGLTWEWNGDAFQFFMVKRDGQIIGTTTNTYFTDILPDFGEYCYTVQAVYDEGQTSPAGPECVEWPDPEILVNPMSLEGWVWVDHQVTVYTTIYNTGIGTLYYEFPDFMANNTDDTRAYCAASGGCDEYISKVVIGTINNSSGCTGYGNYTSQSTEVETGGTYPITITNGNPIWTADQCGIWVDWNLDEDFTNDGNITVSGSPGVGPYTANILVPDDAEGGPTRIRIRIVYAETPTPCGTSFYGECEDYTLDVQSGFIVAVEPNFGTVASGSSQQIAITYDATGFEVGTYLEELLLNSNDRDEGELIINNTMHVYVPAQFAGTVYDMDDNQPLNGVTVTAGSIFQTTTNEDGEYSLFVDQGTYDVVFEKLGYMDVTVADTFALQGVVTPISIGMWDMNY